MNQFSCGLLSPTGDLTDLSRIIIGGNHDISFFFPKMFLLDSAYDVLENSRIFYTQSHRNDLDPILLSRNQCCIAAVFFFHVANYKGIDPQWASAQPMVPTIKRVKLYCYCVSLYQFL